MLRDSLPNEMNLHILGFLELEDLQALSLTSHAGNNVAGAAYQILQLEHLKTILAQSTLWEYLPLIANNVAEKDGKRLIEYFKQFLGQHSVLPDPTCPFQNIIEQLKASRAAEEIAKIDGLYSNILNSAKSLLDDVYADSNFTTLTYPGSLNDFLKASLKENEKTLLGKYRDYASLEFHIVKLLTHYFMQERLANITDEPEAVGQRYVLEFLSSPAMKPYRSSVVPMLADRYSVYAFEYLVGQLHEYYAFREIGVDVSGLCKQLQVWVEDLAESEISLCIDGLQRADEAFLTRLNINIVMCLKYSTPTAPSILAKKTISMVLSALEISVADDSNSALARSVLKKDTFDKLQSSEQHRVLKLLSLKCILKSIANDKLFHGGRFGGDAHVDRIIVGYIAVAENHAQLEARLGKVLREKHISSHPDTRKLALLNIALMLAKAGVNRDVINQVLDQVSNNTESVVELLKKIGKIKELDVNGNETDVAASIITHFNDKVDRRAIIGIALTSSYSKAALLGNKTLLISLSPALLMLFVENAGT